MDNNDYEKELEIDKYALDTECLDQPRRFMVWSEQLATASAERDRTEQQRKIIEAQVEQKIRGNPDAYGGKLTEAGIKSHITINSEVIDAQKAEIDASYRVNVLLSAKQAFEQRRSMLENLVKLFLSGYWAEPKIKEEEGQALTKASSEEQKAVLNKSPRLIKRT
jgi:hypothetical protein